MVEHILYPRAKQSGEFHCFTQVVNNYIKFTIINLVITTYKC